MIYTIYKTTCAITGQYYIGQHQTEKPNDGYLGSGLRLKAAIQKYGKQNFVKEILFEFDNKVEMNLKESEIVDEEFCARGETYNLAPGGQGGLVYSKHPNEGRKLSETHKANISAGLKRNPPISGPRKQAVKDKISKALKGKSATGNYKGIMINGQHFKSQNSAAKHFSVSPSVITKWKKNGKAYPTKNIGGSSYRSVNSASSRSTSAVAEE